MDILRKIEWKNISMFKLVGFGLLVLFLLTIVIWLLGFAFRTAFFGFGSGQGLDNYGYAVEPQVFYEESYVTGSSDGKLSSRNILPPEPPRSASIGTDAEEFEVTDYFAAIRTHNLADACDRVEGLKPLNHVIFENAGRFGRGCSYTFKVENDRADEVLVVIKSLKPDTFRENTYTVKPVVADYTSEIEILEKKLASVEETLTDAQAAYDEVTILATRTQDVESLAKIIDSKVALIERLTLERININERIDRLHREKAEQLDRLNFTFFNVQINEFLIFDLKQLKDSWITELKGFVREFNDVLQGITINLASFMLRLVQVVFYLLIALFIVKYGWRFTKKVWKM